MRSADDEDDSVEFGDAAVSAVSAAHARSPTADPPTVDSAALAAGGLAASATVEITPTVGSSNATPNATDLIDRVTREFSGTASFRAPASGYVVCEGVTLRSRDVLAGIGYEMQSAER